MNKMPIYFLNRLSHEWLQIVDILIELCRCEFYTFCIFHQGVKEAC